MSVYLKNILKHKALNGWGLFALISLPMSAFIIAEILRTNLSTGEGLSHMIGYSVRWAVPFIYLVIAASSVRILFPGPFSTWWLKNRKYIGLCFAAGMAWQGLFIFIISTFTRDYYFNEIYLFRDELEGTIGYLFLVAMVVTSFHFGRKHINSEQWKLIQKSGVYFLWAYPFSVYWWNLFYYPTLDGAEVPRLLDYVFYWAGFAAFAVRIAAWGKQRHMKSSSAGAAISPVVKLLGGALILAGLVASATGKTWREPVSGLFTAPDFSEEMVNWLPFWPLEPFLPLLVIGLGTFVFTHYGAENEQVSANI